MSNYNDPPRGSSRRRDSSYGTPYYPQEPQHSTPHYPSPQAQGVPFRTPNGMPRIIPVSPRRNGYVHSPPRSPSPPTIRAERQSNYGHTYSGAQHASASYYRKFQPQSRSSSFHTPPRSTFSEDWDPYYDAAFPRAQYAFHYNTYPAPLPPSPNYHSQPHFHPQSQSHFPFHSQPQHQSSSFPTPPQSPKTNTSAEPYVFYTFEDEEPDRIPIAPWDWNNYSTSASKEELISYHVENGADPEYTAMLVHRIFADYAPQHSAITEESEDEEDSTSKNSGKPGNGREGGRTVRPESKGFSRESTPSPPLQEQRKARRREPPLASTVGASTSRFREEYGSKYQGQEPPSASPESGRYWWERNTSPPPQKPRRREPPLDMYRSHSPVSYSSSSSGSSSGSGTRIESGDEKSWGKNGNESREERMKRKENRAPLRAPSPPAAASRAEAEWETRYFYR